MANRRFRGFDQRPDKGKPPAPAPGHRPDATPEGTAAWAGPPGKTQPKTRDKAGTQRVKQSAKQEGL